jgi:molecular chaperone HscB
MADYFQLLDIAEAYHVDVANLRKQFLKKSRESHPDFFTMATSEQQQQALTQSALVNQAWQWLSDPHLRLQYLLTHYGILSSGDQTNYQLSPDFLMQVMELNEQLTQESENQQHDAAAAAQEMRLAREAQIDQLMHQFDAASDTNVRKNILMQVLPLYLECKYLRRLR